MPCNCHYRGYVRGRGCHAICRIGGHCGALDGKEVSVGPHVPRIQQTKLETAQNHPSEAEGFIKEAATSCFGKEAFADDRGDAQT